MTVRTDSVTQTSMSRGFVRLIQILTLALAFLLVAAGPVSAADDLSTSLDGGWGRADVKVSHYGIGALQIEAWITDTKDDSRCVYVEYKVKTAYSWDPDQKIVRVCGNGDEDYGIKTQYFPTQAVPQLVEFKLCREQGFGRDPCVKETVNL